VKKEGRTISATVCRLPDLKRNEYKKPVRLLILEKSQNRAEELIALLRIAGRATRAGDCHPGPREWCNFIYQECCKLQQGSGPTALQTVNQPFRLFSESFHTPEAPDTRFYLTGRLLRPGNRKHWREERRTDQNGEFSAIRWRTGSHRRSWRPDGISHSLADRD